MNKTSYTLLFAIIFLTTFNVWNNRYITDLEEKNQESKKLLEKTVKETKKDIIRQKDRLMPYGGGYEKRDLIKKYSWLTNPDFNIFVDSSKIMLHNNLEYLERDIHINSSDYQDNNIAFKYFYILTKLDSLIRNKTPIKMMDFFIALRVCDNKELKIFPFSFWDTQPSDLTIWDGNQKLEISHLPFHYTKSPENLKAEFINPITKRVSYYYYE